MSECFLGEIRMFAGTYAPQNWSFCDGTALAISQYQALFTLLGTIYGGDGVTTFKLPELRGRVPIGQGNGTGLTPRPLGQFAGTETVTLATANLPQHNHAMTITKNAATAISPTSAVPATPPTIVAHNYAMYTVANPTPAPTPIDLAPMMRTAGTGGPHENMMPGLCVNFIIALFGIFPSQS